MCLRVALPTQTSGRTVLGGRGECWSSWDLFSLAPLLGYDLTSGQAVPCRPQWGMAWDRKRRNESTYRAEFTNHMMDRKGGSFTCYTIMFCLSIGDMLP